MYAMKIFTYTSNYSVFGKKKIKKIKIWNKQSILNCEKLEIIIGNPEIKILFKKKGGSDFKIISCKLFFSYLNKKINFKNWVLYLLTISLHQFFGNIENFTRSNFQNNRNFQITKFSEQPQSNFQKFWKTSIPDPQSLDIKTFCRKPIKCDIPRFRIFRPPGKNLKTPPISSKKLLQTLWNCPAL